MASRIYISRTLPNTLACVITTDMYTLVFHVSHSKHQAAPSSVVIRKLAT